MNSTIYYFSSTGNSQHVAQLLQCSIKSEILPMVGNIGTECKSDVIGIVFPTFFWGIPNLVHDFVESLRINSSNPYIFAITVCGLSSGGALGMIKELLRNKDLKLSYGNTVVSVKNYIVEYDINLNSVNPRLKSVQKQIDKISYDILQKKKVHVRKPLIFDKWFYAIYERRRLQDYCFEINSRCTGCGTCKTICPVNNICIEDGKPQFQHHCEHCIACIHWCPSNAIEFTHKTVNRNRYHNPHITIDNLNK